MLGLCAQARMGKDTLADILVSKYGWRKYSFAEPIKKVINALFSWDERHSNGELKEVVCDVEITGTSVSAAMRVADECGLYEWDFSLNDLLSVLYEHAFEKDSLVLDKEKNTGRVSPRKAYQVFGTEYGRNQLDDDIWLNLAPTGKVVIADVRFENEAAFVRKQGVVAHIYRNTTSKVDNNSHVSEQGVRFDLADYLVDNDGSLEDLHKEAAKLNWYYTKRMIGVLA